MDPSDTNSQGFTVDLHVIFPFLKAGVAHLKRHKFEPNLSVPETRLHENFNHQRLRNEPPLDMSKHSLEASRLIRPGPKDMLMLP